MSNENTNTMDDINSVADYLGRFGASLAQDIERQAMPLHQVGIDSTPQLDVLLRRPFPAQIATILGLSKALETRRAVGLVGEMGTGKSLMGAVIPFVVAQGQPYRCLVMCPSHLVQKWQREIKETIPQARAQIIRSLDDVMALDTNTKADAPTYFIVSKERAKLSYRWRAAFNTRRTKGGCFCPDCGALITNRDDTPLVPESLQTKKHHCLSCLSPLWCADGQGLRRFAIADYIKRYLKDYFDFFVADEVHELKSGESAQGNAFGTLASACGRTIAMTGTLLNGYSDSIFYILYRMDPRSMIADGLKYHDVRRWVRRYGVEERVILESVGDAEDNATSKGRKKPRVTVRTRPGCSPLVFARHLLGSTAFVHLDDIHNNLPSFEEQVVAVPMDASLAPAYQALAAKITTAMKAELAQGGRSLLGTYLQTLLLYPDRPHGHAPIAHPKRSKEIVAVPENLALDAARSKEQRLVELVKAELAQNRRIFVYFTFTGAKDVTGRIRDVLEREGIKVAVLKAAVEPERREKWIEERVDEGVQVLLGNFQLVATGLDLLAFPTLVFYQTGYNTYLVRQASRRSWRLNQTKPVRVVYLYYQNTLQENAIRLIASKVSSSMALEGHFTDEGLAELTNSDDMSLLLAKSLVQGMKSLPDARSSWKALSPPRHSRVQAAVDIIAQDVSL